MRSMPSFRHDAKRAQASRFPSPHSRSEWRGGGRGGGACLVKIGAAPPPLPRSEGGGGVRGGGSCLFKVPPTPDPSPPLASLAGGGEPRGLRIKNKQKNREGAA